MKNTVILYRPYPEIEASVESLSPRDLFLVGRLNASLIVKNILGALGIYDHSSALIENNHCVNYYWNDGKPFLNDVVYYYNVAQELWMDQGGLGYDYLEDCWNILEECDWIENEAKWTEEHGNIHQLLLLSRHHQWYQRKFRNIRDRTLKDPNPFTASGKPRKVKQNKIRSITYEQQA